MLSFQFTYSFEPHYGPAVDFACNRNDKTGSSPSDSLPDLHLYSSSSFILQSMMGTHVKCHPGKVMLYDLGLVLILKIETRQNRFVTIINVVPANSRGLGPHTERLHNVFKVGLSAVLNAEKFLFVK
jgi:hypothetical protein